MTLLVDEPSDCPSAQQFRQLVPKIVERGGVGQVAEWVLWEKTLLRRDLVIGEIESGEVRRSHWNLLTQDLRAELYFITPSSES